MDTVKIDKKSVRMVAHQGCHVAEQWNSCPAFVAAGNRSYWGIETDIHVTADGRYVVHHDVTTDHITGGLYRFDLTRTPSDILRTVRLPDIDGRFRSDLVLPFVEDYIAICKRYGKVAVLEVKDPFTAPQLEGLIAILREMEYLQHTVFISFHLESCLILRELLPDQPIQYLTDKTPDSTMLALLAEKRLELDIEYHAVTRQVVEFLHGHGLRVNVWTCDDPAEAAQLIALGVDYITSNTLE